MNKIITRICVLAMLALPGKGVAASFVPGCYAAVADTAFVRDTARVVSTRLSAGTLVVDTTLMVYAPSFRLTRGAFRRRIGCTRYLHYRVGRQFCPHLAIPPYGLAAGGKERLLFVVHPLALRGGRHARIARCRLSG